ncbi:alpha/beta fold hydrolase [Serratia sp. AKBS12]|uniref:alpha/beta fold hydrolase n=1 Tax=Serratia sp. AKBS12 TaxID=2974597 RepID=UPI0021661520|nr:alpha/beta fold hydrolase [Serratia sp. AKBS12]MCS3406672.1 alpha/beta fold hydrolase [Serratia sp. AKBS12]HEI8868067.1 alpha/beta fold hydrolase [Serratia odorifera]
MDLKEIRSFFVGGHDIRLCEQPRLRQRLAQGAAEREIDMNGDIVSGQMYVQAFIQNNPCSSIPILLWHGGGMTGANWESTPDGRPGWLQWLLQQGWNLYLCDAVERGRSGWSPVPEVWPQPPLFRTKNEAWQMFRIGPSDGYHRDPQQRQAFSDSRFPLHAFDYFACQWVPRWSGHEAITLSAYHALLDSIGGPCIIIGHSQGGGFALQMAVQRPQSVLAVVALEPSGAPQCTDLNQAIPPHLVLWGDHLDQHAIWQRYRSTVATHLAKLHRRGIRVDELDLPQRGIRGNSHFLMLDNNAQQLLTEVTTWLHTL